MSEFAEWDSFYVIVGSAAGALIGLQFVVMTLIAQKPVRDMQRAGAAFATPTVAHFGAALLVSALMRVPWPALLFAAIAWGITGACGLCIPSLSAGAWSRKTPIGRLSRTGCSILCCLWRPMRSSALHLLRPMHISSSRCL